eukprot:TRINITY_DN36312_c0_g1_i1.p1 TRINITY_DN36312_c0_g1~~TRINITY_DN36312_c0_g1_i1.p1  ORF type:complete len:567 (+),score=99.86 TRINITY_DN36312_c0_g1_i1:65-1765(+)
MSAYPPLPRQISPLSPNSPLVPLKGWTGSDWHGGAYRSVVAFDVDKTVLHQGDANELQRFRQGIGPTLVSLARHGLKLAAVTGNDLENLSKRFLKGLVEELCFQQSLELLYHFHFFCNGAAVYVNFAADMEAHSDLLSLCNRIDLDPEQLLKEARICVFDETGMVKSRFIHDHYAQQCSISKRHAGVIMKICEEECSSWWSSVCRDGAMSAQCKGEFYVLTGDAASDAEVKRQARVDEVNKEATPFPVCTGPTSAARTVLAMDGNEYVTSCNVKPILSFRHARGTLLSHSNDPRVKLVKRVRRRLAEEGMTRYLVNPGGRGSIDISHHLVNKHSALTWLLRHLNAEGVSELGEPLGINCVFFGDEVVFNGNDLPVADIPGVLVFAVNELAHRVPFHMNISLPTAESDKFGPDATHAVLKEIDAFVKTEEFREAKENKSGSGATFIARWKEQRLRNILKRKCDQMLGEMPKDKQSKFTYQRLQGAAAAMTAMLSKGEGLDKFAIDIVTSINSIGSISNQVAEQNFEATLHARGYHTSSSHAEPQTEDEGEDAAMNYWPAGFGSTGRS